MRPEGGERSQKEEGRPGGIDKDSGALSSFVCPERQRDYRCGCLRINRVNGMNSGIKTKESRMSTVRSNECPSLRWGPWWPTISLLWPHQSPWIDPSPSRLDAASSPSSPSWAQPCPLSSEAGQVSCFLPAGRFWNKPSDPFPLRDSLQTSDQSSSPQSPESLSLHHSSDPPPDFPGIGLPDEMQDILLKLSFR